MKPTNKEVDDLLDLGVAEMRKNAPTAEQVQQAASRVLRNLKADPKKVVACVVADSDGAELIEQ